MKIVAQVFRAAMLLLFFALAALPLKAAPWIETASFFNSGGSAGDDFGDSVAVDGNVAIVGQPATSAAFVFVRSGGSWSQAATLVPDVSTPLFGISVAISGDTVVVGSPDSSALGLDDEGLAFVFVRPSGGWSGTLSPNAILEGLAANGQPEALGFSVAISGSTAAIGAIHAQGPFAAGGGVFVYEKPAAGWSGTIQPSGSLFAADGADGDELGWSVGISGDTVVGGAPLAANGSFSGAGKAYIWVKPAGGWNPKLDFESAEILPSDPIALGGFGFKASIDGATAVVMNPYFNSSDPTLHAKGYVFVQPASGWSGTLNENAQLLGFDATNAFAFGQSVSISGDTVVIGAPFADTFFTSSEGAAYIFEKPSGGWSGPLYSDAKIYRGSGPSADLFGDSVAISGTTILAGAPGETLGGNPSQGAVHVFEPGLDPIPTASFSPGSVYTFQPATLSISVTNPNSLGFLSNLEFASALSTPSGLDIDAIPNISNSCGGVNIIGSPQFLVGMFKGDLPASSTCGLTVNVSSGQPNTYSTGILPSNTYIPFYCDQGCYGITSNTASLLVGLHPTQTRFLVKGPIRVAPGVPVEFPFEVNVTRSEIEPTGEVVISDGAGHSCRTDLSAGGRGSCSLAFGSPGTFVVHASYLGNLSFQGSTSPAEPVLVHGASR